MLCVNFVKIKQVVDLRSYRGRRAWKKFGLVQITALIT